MTGDTYPLCTVWVAPCSRCGAEVLTDQYLASPYFAAGCECGGWPDETAVREERWVREVAP